MLETSARLLRLLSLFQARRYWSGADLAERLEVTTRTLRRDVDKLRSLGYPIHSEAGTEGGYQLGAGSTMPPLLLDDEEAVAVALGLRSSASAAITGIEEPSLRALAKIEQILPARLGRRVTALQTMIVTAGGANAAVNASLLGTIAGACRDQESLQFRYTDRSDRPTVRTVEPYRLVHTGRRWYLVAWDEGRQDWRTFRVDRMQSRVTTGPRFEPREPPSRDLAAYVTRGVWHAPPCRARLKVMCSAEALAAQLPPCLGYVEPIDEQCCHFEAGASSWEGLATHLALLAVDFEVNEPKELLDELQRLASRFSRAARVPESVTGVRTSKALLS